uniref:Osteoclast-stimulating factor 1 n=2 Tax=Lepisosteus oculatus TaxID=7918 RepID=W5MNP9_LEPOC
KMKDPVSGCTYNLLYQDLKKFSKNGEHYCKELMTVFQQRADLEISYAKGLQKLANKLTKASSGMTKNSTYIAWSHVSDEMCSTADIHRTLGNAFQQEAIQQIRQVLDDHTKKKKPLDNAVEKSGKYVQANWNEQIKIKKKLFGLTKEHEALFNFVESNKHLSTEKEKQKMLNRLTKSAEVLARTDEEYYHISMAGHEHRIKWETTLKNCYQSIQELEKQRIEILCEILNKYNEHISSFGKTLIICQKQIDQAIKNVNVEKDIRTLVEETTVTSEDNKAEFLLADYFEEDNKTTMTKDRRKASLKVKLQRLQDNITKTRKDREGLEKMMKTYNENPAFSNKKNLEETEQLLDETTLKLNLLEATYFKLSTTMAELQGKPKPTHQFSDSITKWKDKDYHHSIVQIPRPVKIKKTPYRSRLSMRFSVIHNDEEQNDSAIPSVSRSSNSGTACALTATSTAVDNDAHNGYLSDFDDEEKIDKGMEFATIGKCRALYDFKTDIADELTIQEGDVLNIHQKDDSGWWYGSLRGKKGHFPSTYVEELPTLNFNQSSEV